MTCSLENIGIQCIADEQLYGSVIIEQQIITEGGNELFILKKVNQPDIQYENGLEKQAEEKLTVDISFRKVSHIQKVINGLSFFFAAFVTKKLDAGKKIDMKVIIINNKEKEKVAKCKLEKEVEAAEGTKTQAYFIVKSNYHLMKM